MARQVRSQRLTPPHPSQHNASWFSWRRFFVPACTDDDAARSLGQAWPKATAERREAGLREAARRVTLHQAEQIRA